MWQRALQRAGGHADVSSLSVSDLVSPTRSDFLFRKYSRHLCTHSSLHVTGSLLPLLTFGLFVLKDRLQPGSSTLSALCPS